MNQNSIIVFVCKHGAAKSIVAATYFNKLASEIGLAVRAVARGTNPDQTLSPQAVTGLHQDGLTPTGSVPQNLSTADVESAQRLITFCELPLEYQEKVIVERWDSVPPVSENYEKARNRIIERIHRLMKSL